MPAHPPTERFAHRHIGPTPSDVERMLAAVGYPTIEAFIDAVVPEQIRDREPLALPDARSEVDALAELRTIAQRNQVATSLIGAGYADTVLPPVIQRNILENPAWYTAYTPYQPEISQGRLEALLNFQTMVADLTGMDVSNASLLDEATAAAEAMTMARRVAKAAGHRYLVDRLAHPQVIEVIRTRAEPLGIVVDLVDVTDELDFADAFGLHVATPGTTGRLIDPSDVVEAAHRHQVFVTASTDLLACLLVRPPGEAGVDAVVGSAQRFGVPLGYGGPHAGFIACRDAHRRSLPGRLVGVSIDSSGRRALRLALQTREQHIRREKATSNICTAQVLLAVLASMYAVYHGRDGLAAIAGRVHDLTNQLAAALVTAGYELVHDSWFDTLAVRVPTGAAAVCAAAADGGINLRLVDDLTVGVTLDETTTAAVVAAVAAAFGANTGTGGPEDAADPGGARTAGLPEALVRHSNPLPHPVFDSGRSETDMLRYIRGLSDLDLALDRAMIPLGSCTMKLNATSEMIPVTWPEFGSLHPFAPRSQAAGYEQLFSDLEQWLCTITGYDAVSLQPNAGSQGEYAGLLAIRAYHESRNEPHRTVCLIPASAHGTNAASAVMAGMRVVVVRCDDSGNVDIDHLRECVETHREDLSTLMVTYPSTHGVFEEAIVDICDLVHAHGGQVYLDGANMNALVGLARPGAFGADVSHLNLHKTFCIPHGGGGPGVGPIGVRAHLAPFLPGHSVVSPGTDGPVGAVSAAPWGSASILPISWMYIAMMGPDGLRSATEHAILSANYVAARLAPHYPVLFTGRSGLVAHECIIDLRPIERACGITNEDVAKRLIDYGFHAPTMSFPVPGTLMIEPTESEPLHEIDRFCDAMIAIRDEIRSVEHGEVAAADSPLRHAPHPVADLLVADWKRPYERAAAGTPGNQNPATKYWPPVGRVDNGYGDRNLVCSCPPPEAFAE